MFATRLLAVIAICAADVLTIPEHRPLMRSEAASSFVAEEVAPITSLERAGKKMKQSGQGLAKIATPQRASLFKEDMSMTRKDNMTPKQAPASKKISSTKIARKDVKQDTVRPPKSGKTLTTGNVIGKSGESTKKSEQARTASSWKAPPKVSKSEKPQPKIERDADGNVLTDDHLANRLFKTSSKTVMPQKVSLLREDGVSLKKGVKIQQQTPASSKNSLRHSGFKDPKPGLESSKKSGQGFAAKKTIGTNGDASKKLDQARTASSPKASAKALKSEKLQPKIERDADGNVLTDDNLANRLFKINSKTVVPQRVNWLKEDGKTVKKDNKPNKKSSSSSKTSAARSGSKDGKHTAESTKKSAQSPAAGKAAGKARGDAKKLEHGSASGAASKKR